METSKSFSRKTDAMYMLTKKYSVPRDVATTMIFEQNNKFAFIVSEAEKFLPSAKEAAMIESTGCAEEHSVGSINFDNKEFAMTTIDPVAAAKAQAEAARAKKAEKAPKTVKETKPVKTAEQLAAEQAAKEAASATKKAEREAVAAEKAAEKAEARSAKDAEKLAKQAGRREELVQKQAKASALREVRVQKLESEIAVLTERLAAIKNTPSVVYQNGKRYPGSRSAKRTVWELINSMRGEDGTMPSREDVVAAAMAKDLFHEKGVKICYTNFKKFYDIA